MELTAFTIAISAVAPLSPAGFFGHDYDQAMQQMQNDQQVITEVAQQYRVNAKTLCAVVFPEYIRYSYLSGLFETASLELLYVQAGTNMVDFSIGKFQMKPSFIETLEEKIKADEKLAKKYAAILPVAGPEKINRKNRISKMSTLEGQSLYACAFIESCIQQYGLQPLQEDEQLRFIAAVYNKGQQYSKKEIEASMENRRFPHGEKFTGEQFAYWEVSLDYYVKHRIYAVK